MREICADRLWGRPRVTMSIPTKPWCERHYLELSLWPKTQPKLWKREIIFGQYEDIRRSYTGSYRLSNYIYRITAQQKTLNKHGVCAPWRLSRQSGKLRPNDTSTSSLLWSLSHYDRFMFSNSLLSFLPSYTNLHWLTASMTWKSVSHLRIATLPMTLTKRTSASIIIHHHQLKPYTPTFFYRYRSYAHILCLEFLAYQRTTAPWQER